MEANATTIETGKIIEVSSNENVKMNIYQKLGMIQTNLKAPKSLYNSFGKYKYRNAEGILEAVKPMLAEYGCILIIRDEIVTIGTGKAETGKGIYDVPLNYIKAVATFIDCETGEKLETFAHARECKHTGMSEDQCTGTASSYARKYCLNALFLLDDTKDSDTDEMQNEINARQQNGSGWNNNQGNSQSNNNNNGWGNNSNQQKQGSRSWGKK